MKKEMKEKNSDLNDRQYGFREERSTNNAIRKLEGAVKGMVEREGMACAVSIDIANAFNTVPWGWIRIGIRNHGISKGLERLVMDYFRDRYVEYRDKKKENKEETGKVGSTGFGTRADPVEPCYDRTINTPVPTGTEIVCYVDDTIIVVGGGDQKEVLGKANLAIGCVTKRIREMGMEVSPKKSEMMLFEGKEGQIKEEKAKVKMKNTYVRMGPTIKYLGLDIDRKWKYDKHFEKAGERMESAADEISRLLPNIKGPGEVARKLYAGVVHAIGIYGAPNWWKKIERKGNKEGTRKIYAAQKRMALRITRAYRTVARKAVTLLAGVPPFNLLAETGQSIRGNGDPEGKRNKGQRQKKSSSLYKKRGRNQNAREVEGGTD